MPGLFDAAKHISFVHHKQLVFQFGCGWGFVGSSLRDPWADGSGGSGVPCSMFSGLTWWGVKWKIIDDVPGHNANIESKSNSIKLFELARRGEHKKNEIIIKVCPPSKRRESAHKKVGKRGRGFFFGFLGFWDSVRQFWISLSRDLVLFFFLDG